MITRRRFAQLSALTFAATQLPAQPRPSSARRIGFAPAGLGSISEIFMRATAQTQRCAITGLVTGHPREKGPRYASKYNVPQHSIYTYENYNTIRDNKAIDAVYIGLPNSMHCEYTVRAAEAGKHVLCEKPMAISSTECRRMIDACRAASVKLMIAYRVHYDPTYDRMRSLIASGGIGQAQYAEGSFPGNQSAGAWRLNRKLAGGGSLFDLGIYPLNAIRYLTGEEPVRYHGEVSTREHGTRFAQVEQNIAWSMRFRSGILANCSSSYGQAGEAYLRINGTQGWLTLQNAFHYEGLHLTGKTTSGYIDEPATGKAPYQFTLEADHFANCILNNTAPHTDGSEGLKDMLAIEAIYRSAGSPVA